MPYGWASTQSRVGCHRLSATFGLLADVVPEQILDAADAAGVPAPIPLPLNNPAAPAAYVGLAWAMAGKTCFKFFTKLVRARVPVGVFTADAAPGQPATFQILGAVKTRLRFGTPLNFDYRTPANTSWPGQKMTITGDTAILQGLQP